MAATPKLVEAFLAFRGQCIWLRRCFNLHLNLFDAGAETDAVLTATAPMFFHDLSGILAEYCLLQACRITDQSNDSLTVKHLDGRLKAEGLFTPEIDAVSSHLVRYRALINDARNKYISHADRAQILQGGILGAYPEVDTTEFLAAVAKYCDLVGISVGVGPLDFSCSACQGDELDLLRVLRKTPEAQSVGGV